MCFNFGKQKASENLMPATPVAQSASYDGGAQVVGAAGSGSGSSTPSGTNLPGSGGFKKRRRVSAGLGL